MAEDVWPETYRAPDSATKAVGDDALQHLYTHYLKVLVRTSATDVNDQVESTMNENFPARSSLEVLRVRTAAARLLGQRVAFRTREPAGIDLDESDSDSDTARHVTVKQEDSELLETKSGGEMSSAPHSASQRGGRWRTFHPPV